MINFCGEDKIILGKAVNFMGPDIEDNFSPGEVDIGVMALFFSDIGDVDGELQSGFKIRE